VERGGGGGAWEEWTRGGLGERGQILCLRVTSTDRGEGLHTRSWGKRRLSMSSWVRSHPDEGGVSLTSRMNLDRVSRKEAQAILAGGKIHCSRHRRE